MGKGSKRRTGESIKNITSNWDEISWKDTTDIKDEETNKNKDDRKRTTDTDRN